MDIDRKVYWICVGLICAAILGMAYYLVTSPPVPKTSLKISYWKDPRTGLCYGLYVGISAVIVPCEKVPADVFEK